MKNHITFIRFQKVFLTSAHPLLQISLYILRYCNPLKVTGLFFITCYDLSWRCFHVHLRSICLLHLSGSLRSVRSLWFILQLKCSVSLLIFYLVLFLKVESSVVIIKFSISPLNSVHFCSIYFGTSFLSVYMFITLKSS